MENFGKGYSYIFGMCIFIAIWYIFAYLVHFRLLGIFSAIRYIFGY
jgi:hypothetical protein